MKGISKVILVSIVSFFLLSSMVSCAQHSDSIKKIPSEQVKTQIQFKQTADEAVSPEGEKAWKRHRQGCILDMAKARARCFAGAIARGANCTSCIASNCKMNPITCSFSCKCTCTGCTERKTLPK